ncbi:MAG: AraC family transcriptional regulator ligand-binding domain-containing protein [Myxococcales bacterium]|nr:AraC family transcriptional regulator ligand-binding domain-containing protein [Myxococcales bacterium]
MLLDIGVSRETVLRRAGLPLDALDGKGTHIPLDAFYTFCAAVTQEANDPELALKTGQVVAVELFDPAFFAAMCSPDMNTAARRLAEFKRLVGVFDLDVAVGDEATTIGFRCKCRPDVPPTLGTGEIVFLVAFARRATRHHVRPVSVSLSDDFDDVAAYEAYFGCPVTTGTSPSVTLTAEDATRPFLTHDEEMWNTFEPSLRQRMEDAREDVSTRERVERALFALLPSGRAGAQDVAREVGMSNRSVQRRLAEEGTTWLEVLNETRERLARHYLSSTEMGPAEVSLLLGFEDPNSLFRAFHRWTGTTPEAWRAENRLDATSRGAVRRRPHRASER